VRTLEREVQEDFRTEWAKRQQRLEEEVPRLSGAFAARGLSRSGELLNEQARIFRGALGEARKIYLRTAALHLSRMKSDPKRSLAGPLAAAAIEEISAMASDFERRLQTAAANMGRPDLAPTLAVQRDSILESLGSDVLHAINETRRARRPARSKRRRRTILLAILDAAIALYLAARVLKL
jgi:hypothetical protein